MTTKKCEYCFNCHRPMPSVRLERLTPFLCRALKEINAESDDGIKFIKIDAYRFKALHARLRHWGLIEEETHVREDGSEQRRSGYWRTTDLGSRFVRGGSDGPKVNGVLRLVEDRVVEEMGPLVNIVEAENGGALPPKRKSKKPSLDEGYGVNDAVDTDSSDDDNEWED